jgi:hypothetical protein
MKSSPSTQHSAVSLGGVEKLKADSCSLNARLGASRGVQTSLLSSKGSIK